MPTDIPRILECRNCFHFWCYNCAYIQYFKNARTPPYLALKFCVHCTEPFDIPEIQILLAVLARGDKIWKSPKRHTCWSEWNFYAHLFPQYRTSVQKLCSSVVLQLHLWDLLFQARDTRQGKHIKGKKGNKTNPLCKLPPIFWSSGTRHTELGTAKIARWRLQVPSFSPRDTRCPVDIVHCYQNLPARTVNDPCVTLVYWKYIFVIITEKILLPQIVHSAT